MVVVVAALVVTLVLTLGGDDETAGDRTAGGGESGETYDLSTPEQAAESFAAAAAAGDGAALLQLTCLRAMACITMDGEEVTEAQLAEAQQMIIDGVDELAASLEGAEFGERTEASIPNAVEIPYTTPGSDDYHAFMFIEFEGDWLYLGSAGGSGGGGGGGGAPDPRDANPPTT